MSSKSRPLFHEPNMSDASILISVENLINIAMGPAHQNTINYKMLETVLHILARQMRMLETKVEIRVSEFEKHMPKKKTTSSSSSPSRSPPLKGHHKKRHDEKKDKTEKGDDEDEKGKEDKDGKSDSEEKRKGKKDKAGKSHAEEKVKGKKDKDGKSDSAEKEKERGKSDSEEKEKGKAGKGKIKRSGSPTRSGSIEVVTASQFELLKAQVDELKEKAGPLPMPAMPDNEQLRNQLVTGSASLADTMDAMQVQARVLAAEQTIERLAEMVTELAAAGALPAELLASLGLQLDGVNTDLDGAAGARADIGSIKASRKSVVIDPTTKLFSAGSGLEGTGEDGDSRAMSARASVTSRASSLSRASVIVPVSHHEMDESLRALKEELQKNITLLTNKASNAAESAANTAKAVAEKMDVALRLNARITHLHEIVADYDEQLSGFDAGLITQMQSFQEQMGQMRIDLKSGLDQLEHANNNAETTAVIELTERYDGLCLELDQILTAHQLLTNFQKHLEVDLRALLEAVEMLREQKADRDEVLDGLRDKADISRLAGLLSEQQFNVARKELDGRLQLCYDKFAKQELVWMTALKDLNVVADKKAELMQLLAAKDEAEMALNDIQDKLRVLFVQLGEPKAAVLTRLLSRGGTCGACAVKALMEAEDKGHGKPPALPAARPHNLPPSETEGVCVTSGPEWRPPVPDTKSHKCRRWVGGSHTLLGEGVSRERASPLPAGQDAIPTRKYTGLGDDGRLYMFEEELQPCVECNKISTDDAQDSSPQETGAGDNIVSTVIVAEKAPE